MSARVGVVLAVFMASWAGLAQAEAPAAEPALTQIHPDILTAAGLDDRNRARRCKSDDCAALTIILLTEDVFSDASMTSNPDGMGPTPAKEAYARRINNPLRIWRLMRQSLLNHVRLYPALCRRIASFASLYGVGEQHPNEIFMGHMVQEALLIDERRPQGCLGRALASLPPKSASVGLIDDTRYSCTYAQWGSAACRRILR